jgi:hypothetical protein
VTLLSCIAPTNTRAAKVSSGIPSPPRCLTHPHVHNYHPHVHNYHPAGEFSLRSNMKYDTIKKNIVLKRFSSIPLADMELVFPEKNVHFSPSTIVNIAITIIGALATLVFSIRGGLSLTSAWTSLTVLAGRVVQVYQTASTQKTEIEKSMGQIVSSRMVASQNAALSSIINDMFSQLTRQIFLAYCILATRPGSSLQELDHACEQILEEQFECKVDFTCEQAVDILRMWGVVRTGSSESDTAGTHGAGGTRVGTRSSSIDSSSHSGRMPWQTSESAPLHTVPPHEAVKKLEQVLLVASTQQSASLVESLSGFGYKIKGVAGTGVARVSDGVGMAERGLKHIGSIGKKKTSRLRRWFVRKSE